MAKSSSPLAAISRAVPMQGEGVQLNPTRDATPEMVGAAIEDIRDVSRLILHCGTMRSLKANLERLGLIPKDL